MLRNYKKYLNKNTYKKSPLFFSYAYTLLAFLVIFIISGNSYAVTSGSGSTNISGALIQSYNADPTVLTGMIVGLKTKGQNEVIPLAYKDSTNMLGVVVPVNNATITLSPQTSGSTQQVLVAPSGEYVVLVSTQGGPIKTGDYLTISSLSGISMKANSEQEEVIGRARGNFNGNNALETTPIKGGSGQPSTVAIGSIPVDVRLAPNPQFHNSSTLPGEVTRTADVIANKSVSVLQIYLSLALVIMTFFVTGVIYYGAVKSSIVSIGRNPLSKKSIVAGLVKVLVVGLIIFASGITASYLVLKT